MKLEETVTFNEYDMAEAFCETSCESQARFLGLVADISNEWAVPADNQWQLIADEINAYFSGVDRCRVRAMLEGIATRIKT